MGKIKKVVSLLVLIIFLSCTSIYASNISDFPASYQSYLNELKKQHPNWHFEIKNVNVDFDTVINNESTEGKSLIPMSYGSDWKRDDNQVEEGWVNASKSAIAYAIDPRNYLNEQQIFQFEKLTYNSNIHNQQGIENILYGTSMYNRRIDYLNNVGNSLTINKLYSQVLLECGTLAEDKYKVNPYHLAARIKQENYGDIINNLAINGKYNQWDGNTYLGDYRGLYNFYNISANGTYPIRKALIFAKTPGNYGEPWDNPEKAIKGGAMFLADKYINKGQNTLYFEKFNVVNLPFYSNQYMTNIRAPYGEASFMYKTYKEGGNLDYPHTFTIPVYNNMPSSPCQVGQGSYVSDYTKIYLDDTLDYGVDDVFRLRAAPDDNSANLKTLRFNDGNKTNNTSDYIITRIEKGINTGWDKIRVKEKSTGNVIDGYMFQSYVYELNYTKVTGISLDKNNITLNTGSTVKLNANVTPSNAWFKDYTFSINNTNIATVDNNGNVTAKNVGTATITVTSEDQNKTYTCTVNVENKVTDIKLDKNEYSVLKDNYLVINPTILPESATNKKYTIESDNENIVKIENNKIKGISKGSANVTFTTEDQGKKVIAKINVLDVGDVSIVIDSSLKVEQNNISKIEPGTKVKDIKSKITTNLKIEIKKDNNVLTEDNLIGTGTEINFINTTNDIISTYIIIIYGDVNGDGEIKPSDYVKVKNAILGVESLSGVYRTAADANKDSEIKPSDYVKIKNRILGTETIVQ